METTIPIAIGIDTGENTGVAVWNIAAQDFIWIASMDIIDAMDLVTDYAKRDIYNLRIVRVEDARKRTWIPRKVGREVLQGVGSVKRDAAIWETFLTKRGIAFEMVAPKDNITKLTAPEFRRLTGWPERTNEHGRDAAGLVWKYKEKRV